MKNARRTILAWALTLAMGFTMLPSAANAAETEGTALSGESAVQTHLISGFAALEAAGYEIENGGDVSAALPGTVAATVDGVADTPVAVTWAAPADYAATTAGSYTFTASAEGYTLDGDLSWPAVTVTVRAAAEGTTGGETPQDEGGVQLLDAPPSDVYVSSSGDNGAAGGSTTPLAGLRAAYEKVAPGGTIYVLDDLSNINNYSLDIATCATLGVESGTDGKAVTIQGWATAGTPAAATRTLSYGNTGNATQGVLKVQGGAQVTLKNIKIDGLGGGADTKATTCLYVNDGSTVTLGEGTSLVKPGRGYSSSLASPYTAGTYIFVGAAATVLVAETQALSSDGCLTGGGTIKRADGFGQDAAGTETYLFKVGAGAALTVKSITVDGNKENVKSVSSATASDKRSLFFVVDGGTLTLDDGAVLENNDGGNPHGNVVSAGAVVVDNGGTLVMNAGAVIQNCRSVEYGAVIIGAASGDLSGKFATFTMNGGEIKGNTASAGNGTVFLSIGKFDMKGGVISGNTAANGAGVYISGGQMTMSDDAVIAGNTAANNGGGGGVSLNDHPSVATAKGSFTMNGGTIGGENPATDTGDAAQKGNSAGYGGGIYVTGGTVNLNAGKVQSNAGTAGSGYFCGGGVTVMGGTVNIGNGTLDGGNADVLIQKNTAFDGAGVMVGNGNGGNGTGNVIISKDTLISGNTGTYGAGVYAAHGSKNSAEGIVVIDGAAIQGNVAAMGGGGLMVFDTTADAVVLKGKVTIAGNEQGAAPIGTPGNTVNNVRLNAATSKLTLAASGLTTGSSIGIHTIVGGAHNAQTLVTGAESDIQAASNAGYFFDDAGTEGIVQDGSAGTNMVWGGRTDVYVSKTGDDAHYGGPDSPFLTLPHAYSVVEAGGTIHVMDEVSLGTAPWDIHTGTKSAVISGTGYPGAALVTPADADADVADRGAINFGYKKGGSGVNGDFTGTLTFQDLALKVAAGGSERSVLCNYSEGGNGSDGATFVLNNVTLMDENTTKSDLLYFHSGAVTFNGLRLEGAKMDVSVEATVTKNITATGESTIFGGGTGVLKRGWGVTGHRGQDMVIVNGGKLSLTNIILDGNKGTNSYCGTLLNLTDGTAELSNVTIQNAKTATATSGSGHVNKDIVFVNTGAELVLDGCSIKTCESDGATTALIRNDGTVRMKGGSITGNTGSTNFTNLIFGGSFIMSGGSITGNTQTGYAVSGSAVTLSGLVTIEGNQNRDILLAEGETITMAGLLTDGSSVGVYCPKLPIAAGEVVPITSNGVANDTKYFFSDKDPGRAGIVWYDGKQVVLSFDGREEKLAVDVKKVTVGNTDANLWYAVKDEAGNITDWVKGPGGKLDFTTLSSGGTLSDGTEYTVLTKTGADKPTNTDGAKTVGMVTTPSSDFEDVKVPDVKREAGSSTGTDKIVINPTKTTQQYAVINKETGEAVAPGWTDGNGSSLTFDGLDPDGIYEVVTRDKDANGATDGTPLSGVSQGVISGPRIEKDEIGGAHNGTDASITVDPTGPRLDYAVVELDGSGAPTGTATWQQGNDGKLTFGGLDPEKDYIIVTRPHGDDSITGVGDTANCVTGGLAVVPPPKAVTAPEANGGYHTPSAGAVNEAKREANIGAATDKITIKGEANYSYAVRAKNPDGTYTYYNDTNTQKWANGAGDHVFDNLPFGKDYEIVKVKTTDKTEFETPSTKLILPAVTQAPTLPPTVGENDLSAAIQDNGKASITVNPTDDDYDYILVGPDGKVVNAKPGNNGSITFPDLQPGVEYKVLTQPHGPLPGVGTSPDTTRATPITTPAIDKDNVTAEIKSDSTVTITVDPADPDTKYAVVDSTGAVVDVTGDDWKTGAGGKVIFEGLTPNTKYEVVAVPSATISPSGTGWTGKGVEVFMPQMTIAVPTAPQVTKTSTSVTIDPTNAALEYNLMDKDGNIVKGQWTPGNGGSTTFDGLDPNTQYTVLVRDPNGGDPTVPVKGPTVTTDAGGSSSSSSSGGGGGASTTVKVEQAEDGKVKVDKPSAGKDQTVTITVTPDPGFELDQLTVTDKKGNELELKDLGNGKYSFVMPKDKPVTVTATFKETAATGDPESNGVSKYLIVDDHIAYMKGDDQGDFRPEGNITRAETAQMFYNLLKDKNVTASKTFSDVSADAWYATAVYALAGLSVVEGVGTDAYEPDRAITRAEFVSVAMRFATHVTGEKRFTDVGEDYWAHSYITGAAYYGWINGYEDGSFKPSNPITRAEAATVVNNMLAREGDKDFIDGNEALKFFPDVAEDAWAYYEIVEATNAHGFTRGKDGAEVWKK